MNSIEKTMTPHDKIKGNLDAIISLQVGVLKKDRATDLICIYTDAALQALALLETHPQPTPQNAEADNIRPSVQAAVDKISQSNSGSDYKSEIIGDLTILRRTDPQNAEALEAFDKIVQNGNHDANGVTFGRPHTQFLRHDHIRTIRAALKAAPKNWLEAQLEEARKDYENWPDWKKKCSRTGEFIRNRDASKDGGE